MSDAEDFDDLFGDDEEEIEEEEEVEETPKKTESQKKLEAIENGFEEDEEEDEEEAEEEAEEEPEEDEEEDEEETPEEKPQAKAEKPKQEKKVEKPKAEKPKEEKPKEEKKEAPKKPKGSLGKELKATIDPEDAEKLIKKFSKEVKTNLEEELKIDWTRLTEGNVDLDYMKSIVERSENKDNDEEAMRLCIVRHLEKVLANPEKHINVDIRKNKKTFVKIEL